MEDVFDIDRYVSALRRWWWWVVGFAVLGIAAALVITVLSPKVYEANTTILVTTPKLRTQFDARLVSTTDRGLTRDLHRTFIGLAATRQLETEILAILGDEVPAALRDPGELRNLIRIEQIDGTSALYVLYARSTDPAFAQKLAAVWSEQYVKTINEVYGLSGASAESIDSQLAVAERELERTQAALTEFRSRTGMGLVDNIQYSASGTHSTGLTARQNLFGLYERYGAEGSNLQAKNMTLGQYRSALDSIELVLAAAAGQPAAADAAGLPLELLAQSTILSEGQLDLESLSRGSMGEARVVLEQVRERLTSTIAQLQSQLETLSAKLSALDQELTGLVRDRALAEEAYVILSLKQTENQTVDALADSWMVVIDAPKLPESPVSPQPLLMVALGAAVGLLVGVITVLLRAWFGR